MNSKDPILKHRVAVSADIPLLARMNGQLIPDEGHRSFLTENQLIDRMTGWIGEGGEYRAVLFGFLSDRLGGPIAYALYRPSEDGIYLRQFFVDRDYRRQGVGRAAMQILIDEIWPPDLRLTVDALAGNTAAIEFWKAIGFRSYSVCLEIVPS